MKFVILQILCGAFGAAIGFALGRLHRAIRLQPSTKHPYAEMNEALDLERQRIRAGQTCTDKSHWH